MAPPSSRRSGHSRKAQYSRFTAYLIAAIGATVGALLLVISLWQPGAFSGLRSVASDAGEAGGQAASITRTGSGNLFDRIAGYLDAGSKNAALQDELEIARIRLEEFAAVQQENARLKGLLELSEQDGAPIVVTRVTGSTASSARRFAYIGAGRNSGVETGMPVRSERGVVGRVLEVANSTSRVLLLTDSESVLPVRRAQDDLIAFAEGRGDGLIRVRLINLGLNPIEVGDMFVTSGAGGYYKPGVAVAIIVEVTDDGGLARMVADPAGTDFVRVEPVWEPEAVEASQQSPNEVLQDSAATP